MRHVAKETREETDRRNYNIPGSIFSWQVPRACATQYVTSGDGPRAAGGHEQLLVSETSNLG